MRRYLATIILAVGALGCFCSPFESCGGSLVCSTPCEEDGKCSYRTKFAGDSPYRCYASSDDDCAASEACDNDGLCHYAPAVDLGACVALESSDCLASLGCREDGRCTLRDGRCVISFAGCMRSDGCRERGECHLETRPAEPPRDSGYAVQTRCEALDVPEERWCSTACVQAGACTRRGNECVATSDEDCQASQACRGSGRCSVGPDGTCVARSLEDCAASTVCEKHNRCVTLDRADFCVESTEPCVGLDRCEERGWCAPYKGICRAGSEQDCQDSRYCQTDGECSLYNHLCRPKTDKDCAQSSACEVEGKCDLADGTCQPGKASDCRDSLGCEVAGLCEMRDARLIYASRCVVGSTKDCADSFECEQFGRCVAKPDPSCRAPEHCPLVCAAPDEPVRLPCVTTRFCKDEGRCIRQDIAEPERAHGNILPRDEECVRRDELEDAPEPEAAD